MPTDEANVLYLYQVLTVDGPPVIDWVAVGAALNLNKGAVTKRWSRLKKSIEEGGTPSASSYPFLWLCVKHCTRDKAMAWDKIAAVCHTTPGAASKRYSRLKQAMEAGAAMPAAAATTSAANSPAGKLKAAPKATPKATPKTTLRKKMVKVPSLSDDDANDGDVSSPTPAPKRKRAPSKKAQLIKAEALSEEDFNIDDAIPSVEEQEAGPAKRAKMSTVKAAPKPLANMKTKLAAPEPQQMLPTPVTEAPTPITEAPTPIKTKPADIDESDSEAQPYFDAHEVHFNIQEHFAIHSHHAAQQAAAAEAAAAAESPQEPASSAVEEAGEEESDVSEEVEEFDAFYSANYNRRSTLDAAI